MLGPPTSHVLSLHRGGALGGAAWVLETGLALQLKVLLEVRGQTDTAEVRGQSLENLESLGGTIPSLEPNLAGCVPAV